MHDTLQLMSSEIQLCNGQLKSGVPTLQMLLSGSQMTIFSIYTRRIFNTGSVDVVSFIC